MIKRFLKSIFISLMALVLFSGVVLAAWEYVFPISVIDTTTHTKDYHPTFLGFSGQSLLDSGKISANGTDTNLQEGSTDLRYMLSTSYVTAVVPSVPSGGLANLGFYTGYTPAQDSFAIIPGNGGRVIVDDAAALELADNFTYTFKGYIAPDEAEYSIYFDGVNDNIDCGNDNSIKLDGYFSIEVWMEADSTFKANQQTMCGKRVADAPSFELEAATGKLNWFCGAGAGANGLGNTNACDDELHHCVFVLDTNVHIYLDGAIDNAEPVYVHGAHGEAQIFYIGVKSGLIRDFKGYIHKVRTWDKPLSAQNVLDLYSGNYTSTANITGEWSFPEGTGTNTADTSPNGNDGTLGGSTATMWHPESNLIEKRGAMYVALGANDNVTARIIGGATNTITGVTAGYYTVNFTANITHQRLVVGASINETALTLAVPGTATDYQLVESSEVAEENAGVPYAHSVEIYIDGDRQLWLQPNVMLSGTNMYDRSGSSHNGTVEWGQNRGVRLAYGEMGSYEGYAAEVGATSGFSMPTASMPDTWFNVDADLSGLPFYDNFLETSLQTGRPVQVLYAYAIIGVAFGAFLFVTIFTRSTLLGYIAMVSVFGIGATMGIIPAWIVFTLIIIGAGIMFLYKQVSF